MSLPSAFMTCSTKAVLVAVLILRGELRLAFIQQDGLRLALAGGGEDDAAVGQEVRRDIVDRQRIRIGVGVDHAGSGCRWR